MSSTTAEIQVQKMLSIIYQIPIGLIEADADGSINAMNAKSVQLLMPLFHVHGLRGDNINELLKIIAPDVLNAVQDCPLPSGNVLRQLRQEISFSTPYGANNNLCFLFTVDKLDAHHFTYVFDDITDLYHKEKELNQMIEDNAIEQLNKFEIASGLLHDIGNAVVGFGSYITKIKRSIEQKNDITTLQNLKTFVEKSQPELQAALGAKKSQAMVDLLSGVIDNQEQNLAEVKNSITDQLKIVSHIQEILNIQRQYVKGHYIERASISVRDLINDAISMMSNALEKREVLIKLHITADVGNIKGDRTKLMQVFLNLLKNAADAILLSEDLAQHKEISIAAGKMKEVVKIVIKDSGRGFDAETGAKLFTRGFTTKPQGTGLGLANCKTIIEGHNGQIYLNSPGLNKGTTATVTFNL